MSQTPSKIEIKHEKCQFCGDSLELQRAEVFLGLTREVYLCTDCDLPFVKDTSDLDGKLEYAVPCCMCHNLWPKPGGRLTSIMSASALFRQDRKATEFRDFVELYSGEITENPEGSFKSSGTGVNTVTLVMDKPTYCTSSLEDYSIQNHEVLFETPPMIEPPVLLVAAAIKPPTEQLSLFG